MDELQINHLHFAVAALVLKALPSTLPVQYLSIGAVVLLLFLVVLTARDLAPDPLYVLATGVTDGYLLKGVRYFSDGARTHSILMDLQSRTVRFVDTIHMFSRTPLREIRL